MQLEIEGIAEAMLSAGGQDDSEPPRLAPLAIALLGEGAVEYAPVRLPGDAALVRVHDTWRVYVRRGLPIERRAFAVAHELAEWWFRVRERYQGEDVEEAANYVAAAMISPRRAFRRAVRDHGRDLSALAHAFRTTQTHVALREAELDDLPRAVIAPTSVRVRGPEEWVWPDASTLRRWAKGRAPGLRKVHLTDAPKRVVLDATL